MNAAKLQLNKTQILDLNMEAIQGGLGVVAGPSKTVVNPAPIKSNPYYITCLNCNPQTNSVSCCDNV